MFTNPSINYFYFMQTLENCYKKMFHLKNPDPIYIDVKFLVSINKLFKVYDINFISYTPGKGKSEKLE